MSAVTQQVTALFNLKPRKNLAKNALSVGKRSIFGGFGCFPYLCTAITSRLVRAEGVTVIIPFYF